MWHLPLDWTLTEYKLKNENDADGKKLYSAIENEMLAIREERSTIVEYIIRYLFDSNSISLNKLTDFLKNQMQ